MNGGALKGDGGATLVSRYLTISGVVAKTPPACVRPTSLEEALDLLGKKRLDAETPQGRPRMVDPEVLCSPATS
jgi:hypothetical protein